MNKKFISAIMAGACALSCMSLSAFAAEDAFVPVAADKDVEKTGSTTYSFNVGFEAPAINVTLPTTLKAVLNPYGIQVEIEDVGKTGKDGVTSPVYTIANNTLDFGIIVKATPSADVGSGDNVATLSATAPTAGDTGNKVYATVKASIAKTAACEDTATKIIFKANNTTAQELLILTKATKPEKKVIPAEGYFQIGGALSDTPAKSWDKITPVKMDLILDIEAASAESGGAAENSAVGSGD